jgi:acetoin utilization protein AcuB
VTYINESNDTFPQLWSCMEKTKTPLKEIMTLKPICLSPEDPLVALKHIYERQKFHHHVLVTEKQKVIGIVSLLDFMQAIGNAGLNEDHPVYKKKVKEIMSTHVHMLEETIDIDQALRIFLKNEIHAIPITANGVLRGIVTSTDLLRFLAEKSVHS